MPDRQLPAQRALVAIFFVAATLLPSAAHAAESNAVISRAISVLRSIGALAGFPTGNMRLSEPVTKEQFAAIFGRALGRKTDAPFAVNKEPRSAAITIGDTPALQPVAPSFLTTLSRFAFAGLHRADPRGTLTHEDAIVAAMRYAAASHRLHPRGFPTVFPRVANDRDITPSARPYVYQALVLNIVQVDGRNRVDARNLETVGDAIVMAARLVAAPRNE